MKFKNLPTNCVFAVKVLRKGSRDMSTYRDVWGRKWSDDKFMVLTIAHIKKGNVGRVNMHNDTCVDGYDLVKILVSIDPELEVSPIDHKSVFYAGGLSRESYLGRHSDLVKDGYDN